MYSLAPSVSPRYHDPRHRYTHNLRNAFQNWHVSLYAFRAAFISHNFRFADGKLLSVYFTSAGFFNRKAENRPRGWKISLSPCSLRRVFSTERSKTGLADGKSLLALVRSAGIFQPEGRKQAFRMENLSWPLFAPPEFFNRKAENRPLGWKISLSTCGGRAAAMWERRPPPLREV